MLFIVCFIPSISIPVISTSCGLFISILTDTLFISSLLDSTFSISSIKSSSINISSWFGNNSSLSLYFSFGSIPSDTSDIS